MRFRSMRRLKAILLFVAALAFAAAPIFSASFAGYEPSDFPIPVREPAIQPAGYAFAIWIVIYAWLIVHAGAGLLRRDEDPLWDRVRWPLMGSLVLGITWLRVAAVDPVVATVLIWAMLGLALAAVLRARAGRDRWLLLAPIAVYAGWLTAAASVSLGIVLEGWGYADGISAATLALILVLTLALTVQMRLPHAPEYGATLIWALIGVIVGNIDGSATVAATAALGIVIMAFGIWRARHP